MAVPVLAELRAVAGEYGVRLDRAATRLLSLGRERATAVAQRLPRAEALLDQPRQRADDAADRLPRALSAGAARWGERFHRAGGGLRPALLTTRLEQAGAALGLKHNRLGSAARGLVQRDAAMLARDAGRLRPFLLTGQKERAAARLGEAGRLLASLGPEQVLGRGYAIVTAANGHLVTSAKRAAQEQALALRFADGEIRVSTATGRQGSLF
jgi:exodeoxyribonuclease VII large subunit